jgi:Domain of Unknown Function (DUF1206)
MVNAGEQAHQLGREAQHSDWLDRGIRFGLVAYGVVHLIVGWLAVQLALGQQGQNASQKGAMQTLARQSYGPLLLWLITIGMFVLVLWRVLEVLVGHREYDGGKRWRRRASSGFKAVIYAYIGYTALRYATGSGSSSNATQYTRTLMSQPYGRWLVGLVGLVIIAYGVHYAYRGWSEKFMEDLDVRGSIGEAGRAYRGFGKAGYIAKGIAFVVVGGLFGAAAVTHRSQKSGGLDQALHTVVQQPLGPVLLILIALGIACYGVFCFVRARHLAR